MLNREVGENPARSRHCNAECHAKTTLWENHRGRGMSDDAESGDLPCYSRFGNLGKSSHQFDVNSFFVEKGRKR